MATLKTLHEEVLACRQCPRLVQWRENVAADPPRRFADCTYHAKAVPGFGDAKASILIVGLAPAAHGANRTGRMFTGDRSGQWLYRALHRANLANQPTYAEADDGLELRDAYITAICRCAPPANKPTRDEIENCAGFLDREIDLLWPQLKAIVALGQIAWKGTLKALGRRGIEIDRPQPKFAHEALWVSGDKSIKLIGSYHPSQQNTFTGRLTEPMFDRVWKLAKAESKP